MLNDHMHCLDRITILLHTRNRPWFLLRAIEYYNKHVGASGIGLVILDGSDDDSYQVFINEFNKRNYSLKIHLLHHSSSVLLQSRLAEGLSSILSPYVLLAADDDFYFFDWLKPAVNLLDSDPSYGVIYGHTIRFRLEAYEPYGELINFGFSRRIPPERWLEDDTPADRLTELGKSNWATVGWYALQRTELLIYIVNNAIENDIDDFSLEKLMIFYQSVLTKTRMLDEIILARQDDDGNRLLYSFKNFESSLNKLINVCISMLSQHDGVSMKIATGLVEKVFKPEIDSLKRNDSRKLLRLIRTHVPFVNKLKDLVDHVTGSSSHELYKSLRDQRFPTEPRLHRHHRRVLDLMHATEESK